MRTAVALLALGTLSVPSAAQLPNLPTFGPDWTDLSYPKLFYTPRDGLTVGLYYAQIRQLAYADFYSPSPYRGLVSIDGQLSTSGSKQLVFHIRFPRMWDGWRFSLSGELRRHANESYFGIGNQSVFDDALEDAESDFYRVDHRRSFVHAAAQRRIVGGLRVLAGLHLEQWRIDTLAAGTQLGNDLAAGVDPTIGTSTNDISWRLGLVFDTRDDEVAARRGVLVEAFHSVADEDLAGDLTYTRTTVSAAGYLSIGERLLLSGRAVGQRMGGTPRLGSYYLIEGADRPYTGLGGAYSHRGLVANRLLGEDKLFANVDVRYDLLALPTLYRVTLVGFLDAGRVFQPEEGDDFRITLEDLKVGGGVGLIAQLFRAAIVGFTIGVGPDGAAVFFYTRWTY